MGCKHYGDWYTRYERVNENYHEKKAEYVSTPGEMAVGAHVGVEDDRNASSRRIEGCTHTYGNGVLHLHRAASAASNTIVAKTRRNAGGG